MHSNVTSMATDQGSRSAAVRALLLDDSSFDRARIRRLSQKTELDIDLDEVGSIAELDLAVKETTYDLILIDYRLPEGDGIEALDHILADPRNKDAGKIMITGNAAFGTAVQAMRGGCHDVLSKDEIDPGALRQAMMGALALARQRQAMADFARQQAGVVRTAVIDALSEPVVAQAFAALARAGHAPPDLDSAAVDAFLATLTDEDEFIFQ